MFPWIYAVLAGIFTTIEASINGKLGKLVTPSIATLHSLITGFAFFLVANQIKGNLIRYKKIVTVSPHWLLLGGIFGALIIYFATKAIPHLGVSKALTVIVAAQLISSLFIDVFILQQQRFHLYKVSGVILLLIGTYFIIK